MASKKVTISLPEELAARIVQASDASGTSVSRLIAEAIDDELRRREGLQAVKEWEEEHGAFTPEERAAARAEAAAADHELISGLNRDVA
jgi:predicted transcriptional regulator